MKTWSQKSAEINPSWKLIDASGKSLGRLASEVAKLIRGKHLPIFTPHIKGGDFVVVINSEKVVLTGDKWKNKKYYRHSRYPGSLKEKSAKDMDKNDLIQLAVTGMLPKNKSRKWCLKKLKIYKDENHEHEAQKLEAHSF